MARRPREPQDLEKRGKKVPKAPSLQKYETERLADKFTNGEIVSGITFGVLEDVGKLSQGFKEI